MNPKQRKIQTLIHDVWRQNPRCGTVSTHNPCSTPGCGKSVRGTGLCQECVVKELGKLTGEVQALKYAALVGLVRSEEWKMLNPSGHYLDYTTQRRARHDADTRTMDEVVEEIKSARLEDDPFYDADHLKEVQEYMNKQHPSR